MKPQETHHQSPATSSKSSASDAAQPIVATTTGKVQGLHNVERGQSTFFGIPYAEPPLGALRFKRTVPKKPWEGVFDASRFGSAGPQKFDPTEGSYEEFTDAKPGDKPQPWVGSEDNLTLNIWTPGADSAKRPVLVWIHGGANWLESGRLATYHGDNLVARGDVVFVSINYRLGVFGWLDLSELGGEEYKGSHSHGMHDQVTALRWIRDNIAAFGGDAENITVMGESAGSIDISWLLTNGHLNGIAKRVVMMSGVAGLIGLSGDLTHGFTEDYARADTRKFLEKIGIQTMEQLQAMSTGEIMERVVKSADAGEMLFEMDSQFWPRLSPDFAPLDPFRAVEKAGTHGIDVMIGYTGYEMGLWLFWDENLDQHPCSWSAARIQDFSPENKQQAADLYNRVFEKDTEGSRGMHLIGDSIFVMPTMWFADKASEKSKVWMYQFDRESDGRKRALHAADQTYLFGKHDTQAGKSLLNLPKDADEVARRNRLSGMMQDAVLAYARHGDPNRHDNADMPAWPQYDAKTRTAMSFDFDSRAVSDPAGLRREWWYEAVYAPALRK